MGLNLYSYLIAVSGLRVFFGSMEIKCITEGGCENAHAPLQ